jgi:heme-degrading monooxygenase HmoA
MQMRVIWGKVLPGQWENYEVAFKKACAVRGEIKGLKDQWLVRDQNDPDAGYSIQLWENDEDMHAFWKSNQRKDLGAMLEPFYANQFTVTHCDVKFALRDA